MYESFDRRDSLDLELFEGRRTDVADIRVGLRTINLSRLTSPMGHPLSHALAPCTLSHAPLNASAVVI